MRSPSDPIRTTWIQTIAIGGIGLLACSMAAVWAFIPVELAPVDQDWRPSLDGPLPRSERVESAEQIAVFEKRLWTPPEVPVEDAKEIAASVPPPPPPKLVLLGIVSPTENAKTGYEAILYDPDTDTIHIARPGVAIGPVTVGPVTSETAELETSHGQTRLRLNTGRAQASQG